MFGAYFQPPVSPLLVAKIEELSGDEKDVREGLKALADEAGTVSLEETQRAKSKSRVKQQLK